MKRNLTMIALLATIPAGALLAAIPAGAVLAGDDCRVAVADWQPREAVTRLAEEKGWTLHEIEIDDGCYEIEGRDREGREIEVKLDPATLRIVEMDYEGDDERSGARDPAPAGLTQPPRNGLFGSGTAPKAQVN